MKNLNNLLFFLFFLVGSIAIWFLLFQSTEISSQFNTLSINLENIRSLSIGDNPVEIRRAVEVPENIKDDMQSILEKVKVGLNNNSQDFLESELVEIVKVFSSFGERASFASSTILRLFERSNVSDDVNSMYFQSLLALVRITKTPESVESALREKCFNSENANKSRLYACVGLVRLGLSVPEEVKGELDTFVAGLLNHSTEVVKSWIDNEEMVIVNTDAILSPLCLFSPILNEIQLTEGLRILTEIIQSDLSSHVKISAINCSIDISSKSPLLLDLISHSMQFESDKSVRKEALLSLLHIGSERSLELAKAYGHKFINGEAPPEKMTAHPFREWAISESLKKYPSQ